MVTIEKIAKLSNCSVSTVSKALNGYSDISEKTRKRVLNIARELGYVPNATAQSLVKKRSNTLGVVYEVEYGLMNLFFSSILESFRLEAMLRGYDILLLSNNTENGMDYLNHCRSKNVAGVLVVSAGSDAEAIQRLVESEIAVVRLDPEIDVNNSIYSDSYYSIRNACRYLYETGHRKIAFIQGDKGNFIGATRLRGYLDFLREKDLKPYLYESIDNTSYSVEDGYRTMREIIHHFGLPDSVVASSDLMAIGAMKYIKSIGYSIPDDVSIIGFDNLQVCEIVTPKLTSINQDYHLIGKKACEMILDKIENDVKELDPIIVETKLVIRDSVKKRH